MEFELHLALVPAPIKSVVIKHKGGAGSEGHHQAVSTGGIGDGVGGEEIRLPELAQMRPQLVALDDRAVFANGESPEPLRTDVIIALAEGRPLARVILVQVGEMEK